jgi:hypothetical protein
MLPASDPILAKIRWSPGFSGLFVVNFRRLKLALQQPIDLKRQTVSRARRALANLQNRFIERLSQRIGAIHFVATWT